MRKPLEYFAERRLHTGSDLGEAFALNLADAGLLEVVELFEKLLETKGSLERAEERVEIDQRMWASVSARRNSVNCPSTRASCLATRAAVA